MNSSVYSSRCQVLNELYSQFPVERIMIVALDIAKESHVGRCCTGSGQYMHTKPFTVRNTAAGLDYLDDRISKLVKQRHIEPRAIVIAVEDPPQYAINFLHRLVSRHRIVVRVNAWAASAKRKQQRATSDVAALDGIVRMVMDQQACELRPETGPFAILHRSSRERRRLVRMETATKNICHRSLEVLFPGFPGTTLVTFGPAACSLMKDNFSAQRIKGMRRKTLVTRLHKARVHHPADVAEALQSLAAKAVLTHSHLQLESQCLASHITTLEHIRQSIHQQDLIMAAALAQTPGHLLTTIPGIGVILAAHIVGEIGLKGLTSASGNLASYAGIIPTEHQTGGPTQPVRKGRLPTSRNGILKDYLMQAAHHAGTTQLPRLQLDHYDRVHDLQAHYQAIDNRGGKSRLSTARKLLRITQAMLRDQHPYQPIDWHSRHAHHPDADIAYIQAMLQQLTRKWQPYGFHHLKEQDNDLTRFITTWSDYATRSRPGTSSGEAEAE